MLSFQFSFAQEYRVTTRQKDDFSIALVKLLNCAVNRFEDCKGDSIRTTWLMGNDYTLTISLPGSVMGIVRYNDWDKNVYVEFRGFADAKERTKGIMELRQKIKTALGDQYYELPDSTPDDKKMFYGMAIKNRNGYFSMNMELFGSSSYAEPYLTAAEREDEQLPGKHFILLKVYGGVPTYQHFIIPGIESPNEDLRETIQWLMESAIRDFDDISGNSSNGLAGKFKGRDTLLWKGDTIFLNYRGQNSSAKLRFPVSRASDTFLEQWRFYQEIVQSALGSDYVYSVSSLQESPFVSYFRKDFAAMKPWIHLEVENENDRSFIQIAVMSPHSKPVKRSRSLYD